MGAEGAVGLRVNYKKLEKEFSFMEYEDSYYLYAFRWIKQMYL